MSNKTWNLSYGYALLETNIPEERVVTRIAEWFRIAEWYRNDSQHNGVDIGAGLLVTEKAYEAIRKWKSRDGKNTVMVSAGNWSDTAIYIYKSEPFGAKPGDLVYIHGHRGGRESWMPYTVDVKARIVDWVLDLNKGVLKAACVITGDSVQFARGDRVTVPINYIRPRTMRK